MATGSSQTSAPRASTQQIAPDLQAANETGAQLVQDLHAAFGAHHARAVHAKGVILEGRFEPSAKARSLSCAALFGEETAVSVRFSNFTGFPDIADNEPGANPRGMAIKFGPRGVCAANMARAGYEALRVPSLCSGPAPLPVSALIPYGKSTEKVRKT